MNQKINFLTFVGVILILVVLVVFYRDWSNTTNYSAQPNTPVTQQEKTESADFFSNIFATSPQVKKSSSDICHEKGVSAHYDRTTNFTPYSSIADCLDSGGRLP